MKKIKLLSMMGLMFLTSSCSVQQFSVNSKMQPFERGGKVWGEKTKKCGENGWELETKKSGDLHILGINVKKSDTEKMANELNAKSYTIETKSNLIFTILTGGMVDYKIVKVIKRED